MGPTFQTGSVKFWDWRDDLEELARKRIAPALPEGVSRARYDHLKLVGAAWVYVDPWTRAEASILLAGPGSKDHDPEAAAQIIEDRGWPCPPGP